MGPLGSKIHLHMIPVRQICDSGAYNFECPKIAEMDRWRIHRRECLLPRNRRCVDCSKCESNNPRKPSGDVPRARKRRKALSSFFRHCDGSSRILDIGPALQFCPQFCQSRLSPAKWTGRIRHTGLWSICPVWPHPFLHRGNVDEQQKKLENSGSNLGGACYIICSCDFLFYLLSLLCRKLRDSRLRPRAIEDPEESRSAAIQHLPWSGRSLSANSCTMWASCAA